MSVTPSSYTNTWSWSCGTGRYMSTPETPDTRPLTETPKLTLPQHNKTITSRKERKENLLYLQINLTHFFLSLFHSFLPSSSFLSSFILPSNDLSRYLCSFLYPALPLPLYLLYKKHMKNIEKGENYLQDNQPITTCLPTIPFSYWFIPFLPSPSSSPSFPPLAKQISSNRKKRQ